MKIDELTPVSTTLLELGRRVARIRKQMGFTQPALAQAAGIGVATLRRLESGSDSQLGTWIRLLSALQMSDAMENLLPADYASPMHEVLGPRRQAARRRQARPAGWGDETE